MIDPGGLGDLFRFVEGRDLLGRLAVLSGFLSAERLEECVAAAAGRPLGEVLLERGLVTAAQLGELRAQEEELRRFDAWGDSPPAPGAGRLVGRYLLAEQLGAGHAGVVWKAWDTQLRRWVALKEAKEEGGSSRERFLREARAAAKLRHPGLIEVLEVGRHEGRDFLVMSFIDGKPLDQVRLDLRRAAEVTAEVADAVQAMHDAGIVHRDIKPANILLDAAGRPHLGDFGIARDLEGPRMTVEGTILGTPVYMAPEQASGQHDRVKPQADVYGLGATLYHLVTGRPPFHAEDDLRALLRRLVDEAPPPPRQLNPQVPVDLEAILLKALEKHPADRTESAAAMAEELRRHLRGEPIRSRPVSAPVRAARWARRHPLVLGASLALLLAVAAFARLGQNQAYLLSYQEGVELWMRASPQEALGKFEAASSAAPGRPEPWLMRGRCLMRLKRPDEAEGAWARALALEPAFGPALLERGKHVVGAYVRLRLPPPARSSGGRLRFGAPEPETAEDRAWRAKGEEYLARARAATGLAPEEIRFIEGALDFGRGRYAESAAALREYEARNRWDGSAAALLGAACYLSGDHAGAEEALTRAIDLQPLPDRHRARGDVRYALGRFAEAVEDYGRAGGDSAALCNRGLALQAMGRLPEAIADYGRALELRSGDARAYNNRGTARAEQLDLAGAQRDFELALEHRELYAEAYGNLGTVLFLQGQVEAAIQQYDLALRCDPDLVDAYVRRAAARRKQKDLESAVRDYEEALRRDPRNADVHFELATAWEGRGDRARAAASLRRALEAGGERWPLRERAAKLLAEWGP